MVSRSASPVVSVLRPVAAVVAVGLFALAATGAEYLVGIVLGVVVVAAVAALLALRSARPRRRRAPARSSGDTDSVGEAVRPDIEAAQERLAFRLGSMREIRHLPEHLFETETVELLAGGAYDGGRGLLALTEQRLIFLRQGWFSAQVEDFPLTRVSAVRWSDQWFYGTLKVFTGGHSSDIEQVPKTDGRGIASRMRQAISQPRPAMSPVIEESTAQQLSQLSRLYESGALSDAEFAAAKRQIVGGASAT